MPVKNLRQRKTEIRSKYRKIRTNLTGEKKGQLDKAIAQRLLSDRVYKEADAVFAFISKDIEVDTTQIINQALSDGKRVAAPRCSTDDRLIDFYYISSFGDLEKGSYGLMEPDVGVCKKAKPSALSVCVVPGLVFDREGYRLGFGKGYYDRFLVNFPGITVGVCYTRCMEQQLPRGFYDKPVSLVVTEKYTVDTRDLQD